MADEKKSQPGGLRIARSKAARYCGHLRDDGSQCRAWALRDSEPPRCNFHAMSAEELSAFQSRGRRARTEKARRKHGVIPPRRVEQAGEIVAALLDAELPDGSGEPDWGQRAWGVLALAAVFKIPRDDRERLLEIVRKARPRLVQDPQRERLLDVERARAELVALYRRGEIPRYLLPPEIELLLVPEPAGPPAEVEA